jgi:hypothetical protein
MKDSGLIWKECTFWDKKPLQPSNWQQLIVNKQIADILQLQIGAYSLKKKSPGMRNSPPNIFYSLSDHALFIFFHPGKLFYQFYLINEVRAPKYL